MMIYTLNGPITYMTLTKRYQKGVDYTADQLGLLVDALNPDGSPLFIPSEQSVMVEEQIAVGLVDEAPSEVEVAPVEGEVAAPERAPRKLVVGKKKED